MTNSDSHDDKADESLERAILRHARHQSPAIADTGHTGHFGTGHTGHIGTGHTGSTGSTGHTGQHRSKHQQSVHRTHSARSDTDDHRSSLINRTLQQHRLDLEYRSAADRSRHHSRSSRKDSGTHRATISLRHADPGELSPAEMLRHRRVRSRSRSYDSVSPRRHSRSPSRSRGKKKKSHKKRKHSSTSSSSRRRSSSSSRERSKHRHVYKKKKKHTKSHSSKRDKHVKKHKRKRSPSPSPSSSSSIVSSSCSSSSRQRSPARKRSRSRSRSSSSAEENSHVPAPRAVSPSLLRDGISLCADDDDQFNSHSEEHQDLIPDTEIRSNASDIHSNMSSEDMRFQNLIEEVFKLLPADRFPRKTEGVLGGNKPLQISLHKLWQPQKFPLNHQIGLTTKILQHLKWWLQEDLYLHGIPMKIDPASHTIFTDASLSGWGAHVEPEGLLFHGLWTEDQSRLHINVLEMKAILLSLTRAIHKVKNSTVLVSTDNTTVVAYIRHQGGTHSTVLTEEVWNILNLCLTHNIQLLVKHIPGRFNTLADRMSRIDKPISTEWSLNQEIANKIFQIMDFPSIDLFATRLNHRLPLYVSPIPDQKALLRDGQNKHFHVRNS